MSELNINKVLEYLKKFRTRKEIEKKFNLSNTESYHLVTWLKKSKLIEEEFIRVSGKTNRQWLYKAKN